MQEIAKNIYSSSIEEQDQVVKDNFPCVECGKTYGTKARARNIAGPGGGEWPVASPLPPPGDSRKCSPGVDLGRGVDLP